MRNKKRFKVGDTVEILTLPDTWEQRVYARHGRGNQGHAVVNPNGTFVDETEFEFITHEDNIRKYDPYANYDGGETQYRADLATLDAAAKASETATQGEWKAEAYLDDLFAIKSGDNFVLESNFSVLEYHNPTDFKLILNVARTASAWARMSKWLRGKGVV